MTDPPTTTSSAAPAASPVADAAPAPAAVGKGKQSRASFRLLGNYLAESRLQLAALVGLGLASGVAEALSLVLILQVAVGLTSGDSENVTVSLAGYEVVRPLSSLLVASAVVLVIQMVVTIGAAWNSAQIATSVMGRVRKEMLHGFFGASWPVVSGERVGELQETMTTQVLKVGLASQFFSQTMTSGLNFLALLVTAIAVDPGTAGVIVVPVFILFFLLRPVSRVAKAEARKGLTANYEYAAAVAETVGLAEEYQTFSVSPAVSADMDVLVDNVGRPWRNGRFLVRALPGLYQGIAGLLIVAGLGAFAATSEGSLAAIGTVVVLLVRAVTYGQGAQGSYHNLVEMLPNVERVDGLGERYAQNERVRGEAVLAPVQTIEFQNVTFAYVPGRDVLHDVSMTVSRGETLGVIGASGSGKSTLMQILLRLQIPGSGAYLVNGVEAADYSEASWADHVAVVPQVPRLIVGTIRENIDFYRGLDDEAIEHAARMAQIHDEILAFAEGYNTHTGPRASNVSGGQRQRICIARALAANPDLLLLDEPTSALDLRSESRFRDSLREISGTRSLVLITHRLSTLELCDRVLVLRDGHVEALRPIDELRGESEFYADTLRHAGIT